MSALHWAAYGGQDYTVKYLVCQGANMEAKDHVSHAEAGAVGESMRCLHDGEPEVWCADKSTVSKQSV